MGTPVGTPHLLGTALSRARRRKGASLVAPFSPWSARGRNNGRARQAERSRGDSTFDARGKPRGLQNSFGVKPLAILSKVGPRRRRAEEFQGLSFFIFCWFFVFLFKLAKGSL